MNSETLKFIENIADQAAEKAAEKTLKRLKDTGRVRFQYTTSYEKTEKLLTLYPKLPADNPTRLQINKALEQISEFDYKDIVASKYFDGLTIQEISDIYDCQPQTISQRNKKMVKILARELFPEDVLKEILEE